MRTHKKTLLLVALIAVAFLQSGFFNFKNPSGKNKVKNINLENIKRISRSTYLVQHEYYDPDRIKPLDMLKEGFYELAKEVPEVLPRFEGQILKFQVGAKSITIPVGEVKKLYDIFPPVSQAFDFLKTNYKGEAKFEDMEYAFVGGMLSVLDPHSNILPPKVYEEFKTQTQGEYGGLGIVIGIKDKELTVISPIEDTPANSAGILADDKIQQIDGQSTTNMTLTEAVDLMRGPPKTQVTLRIKSKNRDPRPVTLTREIIIIKSVVSKLIEHNGKKFGVLRLKGFQEDTFKDMNAALKKMRAKAGGKLDGIALDMRNNPGGLLDQAILIADKFLESGDIVFTVGANNVDEETAVAKKQNNDAIEPMVVLINQGSASASEIVAGALKNNGRAVVLGQKSFGKGSVQSLFSLRDGSSLKLTVAQYLTPGRESIQAVGIYPDIHLYASAVNKEFFDLIEDINFGEDKLDAHLDNKSLTKTHLTSYTLTHLKDDDPDKKPESNYTSKIKDKDYAVQLALKILHQAPSSDTKAILGKVKNLIEKESEEQDKLVIKALKEYKIDWSLGKKVDKPKLSVKYELKDAKDNPVSDFAAGTEVFIHVTVQNTGTKTLHRVLTDIDSLNPLINNKEFVFGKVEPGESKSAKVVVKIPPEIISFSETVKLLTYTQSTVENPLKKLVDTRFTETSQPQLAFSYSIIDKNSATTKGNGNGIPEKGEKVEMKIAVKNLGPGESKKTLINIKNKEGRYVFLKKARADIGLLKPNQETSKTLSFEVKEDFTKDEFSMDIFALDDETKSSISDTLKFKITEPTSSQPTPGEMQIAPKIAISANTKQTKDKLKLVGSATSPSKLKDIAIFVKGKKLHYINLENEKDPHNKTFDVELPLEDGINSVVIQARNERNIDSQKTMSVVFHKDDQKIATQ